MMNYELQNSKDTKVLDHGLFVCSKYETKDLFNAIRFDLQGICIREKRKGGEIEL